MSCMRDGFLEGQLLDGRFEAMAPLNHGSFGMVFLAKDNVTGEQVAIKCSSKTVCESNIVNSDYLIELTCHTRLGQHPNIVNLVHAFETEHHMYLVLEFCSMGDLYEAIRLGRGPLETEHVRSFMLELVDAVDFMHSKGLFHRDIKPENVFLCQDGSMKLGDFGLSTTETWTFESSVGSDRYMAPEQYDASDIGYSPAKVDVWAIGICLLNILFSRNPFVTPSESDVIYADFVMDKQSLFDVFPSMSQDTFDVLVHALAIDPEKRSLDAVRAALERVETFTLDDDVLDDFCTEERDVVPASANRQPLRTPSIQSPPDQGGAFPWAKALKMTSPPLSRQLSTIYDIEPDHDIFPVDDFSASQEKHDAFNDRSIASVIDSKLGASVKSMTLREPKPRNPPKATPAPMNSLPVTTTTKPLSSLASIFGKKNKQETVSKSWSDMWEEEEEEELEDARRRFNNQNFSTESLDEDITIRPSVVVESKGVPIKASVKSICPASSFGDSSSEDVSSLESIAPKSTYNLPVYSPPSAKKRVMDWAALGNFRRAYNSDSEDTEKPEVQKSDVLTDGSRKRSSTNGSWRKGLGMAMKPSSGNRGRGVGLGVNVWGGSNTSQNSSSGNRASRKGRRGDDTIKDMISSPKTTTSTQLSSPTSFSSPRSKDIPGSTATSGGVVVRGFSNNGLGFGNFSSAGGNGFGGAAGGHGSVLVNSNNKGFSKNNSNRDAGRIRIRDWRREQQDEVHKYHYGKAVGSEITEADADVEWVGGWHDLHL